MSAVVVTIGTEITRGELLDTNSHYLASRLCELGFEVLEIVTVDDDRARIRQTIERVSGRAKVVLVTGGLGPTTDDLTAQSAADAAGVGLVRHEPTLATIERKMTALGREMTPARQRMADVPASATVLGNPAGTAPGFMVPVGQAQCFFMPGVPAEMKAIFENLVVPRIGPMGSANTAQVVLRTYGLPEATVGELLAGLEAQHEGLVLGYRLVFPEVEVKVRVRAKDVGTARERANRIALEARARLGDAVFGEDEDSFAGAVGKALRARGFTLAVAESCTGGLIGALLTSVSGSSDYFLLDAVTYANAAKERVLGVSPETLMAHGAVSRECAEQMAKGARRVASTDIAVSVTGIAGPGGGSEQKPVGTVFFAVATEDGVRNYQKRFDGDRVRVQRAAAFFALQLVREACGGPLPAPMADHCI
ncbi:MAG: competence/damage-inducible protein A [Myxococcales bacterium]|nr:competence/damage-inducible protein A [Myxococcales bacterium]